MRTKQLYLLIALLLFLTLFSPAPRALASFSNQEALPVPPSENPIFLPFISGPSNQTDPLPTITPEQTETPVPTQTPPPTETPVPQGSDLSLDVTSNTKTVLAGQVFSYILTAANAGPDPADQVVVQVTIPAGLTFTSANPVGSYNVQTRVWSVGTLTAGQTSQLTLVFRTASGSGSYTASGVISSTASDPNLANNQDSSLVTTVSAGTTFISDDFNYAPNIRAPWAFVNPKLEDTPDTSRAWTDGTHAYIEVMAENGGHEPNCFYYRNCTPRLVQRVSNPQQFTVRAKFQSANFTGTRKSQGLLLEQARGEYLYMSFFTEGNSIYAKAVDISSTHYGPLEIVPQRSIQSEVVNRELLYMQLTRDGSTWKFEYSADGGRTWVTFATHTRTMTINYIGVFAGNGPKEGAPAFTARVDYVFNMDSPIEPEDGRDASGIVSDDFNAARLSSAWTLVNPLGTPNLLLWNPTQLKFVIPAVIEHDLWDSSNNTSYAPQILQRALDTNFDITVKFDSALAGTFTAQGLVVKTDERNFLQYYYYSYNFNGTDQLLLFASLIRDGVQQLPYIVDRRIDHTDFGSPPMHLRIQRDGLLYRLYFSPDGVTWTQAASVSTDMVVKHVGVFAGTEDDKQGGVSPALTSVVDHFQNLRAPLAVQD